ncbi:beta-defensin 136 [Tupaia chinensis]|uniref:beta-defensin 136 n=1 Tax=Tupaia chinensis TaxID=246437 RepID=UPI0003C8CE3C|nr:beta-defensin 136 [Tupaia chinensis]XP_027621246.1 beta-defensin 136 [Tupaia chinensis]
MSLYFSGLLFFLVTTLPSGNGMFGNDGVDIRTCVALEGKCFFGCTPGWTWIAFCHNILSCCKKQTVNIPPQAKEPWDQ